MNERRTLGDAQLDALLVEYFGSGSATPRERVVEGALLEIATTPQEGAGLARLRHAFATSPASWAVAAVAVLALGIGLLLALRPVGVPTPPPQASPTPTQLVEPTAQASGTAEPAALVLYRNSEDGYEVLIPDTWRTRRLPEDEGSGMTIFQVPTGPTSGFAVMWVSVGDANGRISLCRPDCATETLTSLEDLARVLVSTLPGAVDGPFAAAQDRSRPIDLGGEEGRLESPDRTGIGPFCGQDWRYSAFAMHESRPVVIQLRYCSMEAHALAGRGEPTDLVTRMIESFRFLD